MRGPCEGALSTQHSTAPACGPYPWEGLPDGLCTAESWLPPPTGLWQRWVINWRAQGEDISSAPVQESGRCRALPRPPARARLARWPNVRLPYQKAAFGPQGRLSQLSATSGHKRQDRPRGPLCNSRLRAPLALSLKASYEFARSTHRLRRARMPSAVDLSAKTNSPICPYGALPSQ
jgi:hypothetical protein